ncbi:MAG: hypothetical protein WA949_02865 [Phormidesmis sp.]
MATPATGPIKKRYTAGSCALEIVAWPSALSQWSEHLIAERLTFRLWLADGASTTADQIRATKKIVAKGDRTALQAVTQYIQAKTRQTLAVPTFGASSSATPSEVSSEPLSGAEAVPACPPEFHYSGSLGYIQLCDLNTVLGQCEQGVLRLPIVPDQQLNEDVILLDAVRDRRSLQSTNVLRLPRRPRKRIGLWASSAAAALLAVGLTTALLSRDSTPQDATVANNSAASGRVSELETAQQADSALESNTLENSTPGADGTRPVEPQLDLSAPTPSLGASSDQAAQPLPKIPNRPTRKPVVQPSASASTPLSAQELPNLPAPTVSSTPTPTRSRSSTSAIAPPPAIPESSSDSLFADQLEAAPETGADIAENNAISGARSATTPQPSASQPTESAQGTAQTASQVQSYFQQRWRGGNGTVLLYNLRLSPDGEVIDFTAINEAAARESENILPTTARPVFSTNPGANGLTLRVLLNSDGTVQVVDTNQ